MRRFLHNTMVMLLSSALVFAGLAVVVVAVTKWPFLAVVGFCGSLGACIAFGLGWLK